MNNEEISSNDLAPGTGNNLFPFTLLGDRVLIKLDEMPQHTTTASGIVVPLHELEETDGGRTRTKTSSRKHLAKGVIVSISQFASNKLKEMGNSLYPGDKVYVSPNSTSQGYYFFPDRDKLVQEFDGYICVSHILIEAKITNNG